MYITFASVPKTFTYIILHSLLPSLLLPTLCYANRRRSTNLTWTVMTEPVGVPQTIVAFSLFYSVFIAVARFSFVTTLLRQRVSIVS